MSIDISLAERLKPYRFNISEKLISDSYWNNIEAVTQVLPKDISSFFIFECPLGIQEAKADFSICIAQNQAEGRILADEIHRISLPNELIKHPIWCRVRNFINLWKKDTSLLHQQVNNIWLEFDLDSTPLIIPIPSFFFGWQKTNSANSADGNHSYRWITQTALKLLLDKSLSSQVEQQIFNCFNLLPPKAYVFQIGVMLARNSDSIRICIRNIASEQILDYLHQIDWLGNFSQLKRILAELSPFVQRIDLDLDVNEAIAPKIGLECYLNQQPQLKARWQLFLDYLVEAGLCLSQKRDALLKYPGYLREKNHREFFSTDNLELSSFLGMQFEWICFRRINHLKIVYQPDLPLQAKAYLSANHSLITSETVRQWRNQNVLEYV